MNITPGPSPAWERSPPAEIRATQAVGTGQNHADWHRMARVGARPEQQRDRTQR